MSSVLVGIESHHNDIFRYRITVGGHDFREAQSHAVISAGKCLGKLLSALEPAVGKTLATRVPEVAVEYPVLVELYAVL